MATDAPNLAGSRLWRKAATRDRHIYTDGSYFEWIERTNDPKFEEMRRRIESLWLRAPESQRAEYETRLRSPTCTNFFSAYNELWYHHALEAGGLNCFAPEKTAAGSLPDWQVGSDDGPVAIAECHLRMQPDKDLRDDLVQRRWFDATFRKLKDKRIRLMIHERVCGTRQPSANRLAKQLEMIAASSPVQVDQGSEVDFGLHRYEEAKSGWQLEFTLVVRESASSDSVAQLVDIQSEGASWCQGKPMFEDVLSRKARQHTSTHPVLICVSWNYFEHEPNFDDVRSVVAKKASSFDVRGVCGVFWTREVYPWNPTPAPPRLLHWGSPGIEPILNSWRGVVVDVNKPGLP